MAVERIIPDNTPGPRSDYSLVSVGDPVRPLAYVSGQTGRKADGSIDQTSEAQTTVAFENLKTLLAAVDSDPLEILHLRTYIVGRDALDGFVASRRSIFAAWFGDRNPPTNTLAIVSGLADPDALVEIEAVASVPSRSFDKPDSTK